MNSISKNNTITINEFNIICEEKQRLAANGNIAIPRNHERLNRIIENINVFSNSLSSVFEQYRGIKFKVEPALGQGNFPKIPLISVLPPDQQTSNGIYVAICFDIRGRGALVGVASSVENQQTITTERRGDGINLRINVNSGYTNTNYNNAFINPIEFFYGLTDNTIFLDHIRNSLDLCIDILNLESTNNRVANIVDENNGSFDPQNIHDARRKIARYITQRRGQNTFRNELIQAYGQRCPVTGSETQSVLEAAHIVPYQGEQTNVVQNGILLRSDIHTLFDLGLISFQYGDNGTLQILLNERLKHTEYANFNDFQLPEIEGDRPSINAINWHYNNVFQHD